jgi:PTH2 family peptidyl-tRNA hydrolase
MPFDDSSGPWHDLAETVETRCREINQALLDQGQRPIPFDVDAARRVIRTLRDAGRPVPSLDVGHEQRIWYVQFTWTRMRGQAVVIVGDGSFLEYEAAMRGDVLIRGETTGARPDLPQAFLDALDHFTPLKQVLVIRRDLRMRQGKAVSQGSHSSGEFMREQILSALDGGSLDFSDDEVEWMTGGMAKITVRADDVHEFEAVAAAAHARGLKTRVITDSGRTEFHGVPTVTALAIGPTRSAYVDPVTGGLTLL